MLAGSGDGRADRGVFVIGVIGHGLEKIHPDAADGPAGKAFVRVAPAAGTFGQIAPWRAGSKLPDHRIHETPVTKIAVAPNHAGAAGKQIFNPRELIAAQCMAFHREPPSGRLPMNHAFADLGIWRLL